MASLISNLAINLAEEIHKTNCKDCDCFLEFERVKDNLIKYKCTSSDEDYVNKIDDEFQKRFNNTFKFSNDEIN